eukprot:1890841-Pleurochrysis_carterae.AAC.1
MRQGFAACDPHASDKAQREAGLGERVGGWQRIVWVCECGGVGCAAMRARAHCAGMRAHTAQAC